MSVYNTPSVDISYQTNGDNKMSNDNLSGIVPLTSWKSSTARVWLVEVWVFIFGKECFVKFFSTGSAQNMVRIEV